MKYWRATLLVLLVVMLNVTVYLANPPQRNNKSDLPAYYLIMQISIVNDKFGVMDRLRLFNTGFATLYCAEPHEIKYIESSEMESGYYEGVLDPQQCLSLRQAFKDVPAPKRNPHRSATRIVWAGDNRQVQMLAKDLPIEAQYQLGLARQRLLNRPVWTLTVESQEDGSRRMSYRLTNRGHLPLMIENPWHMVRSKQIVRTRFFFQFSSAEGREKHALNLPTDSSAPGELLVPLLPQQALLLEFQPNALQLEDPDCSIQGVYQGKIRVGDGPSFRVRSESRIIEINPETP